APTRAAMARRYVGGFGIGRACIPAWCPWFPGVLGIRRESTMSLMFGIFAALSAAGSYGCHHSRKNTGEVMGQITGTDTSTVKQLKAVAEEMGSSYAQRVELKGKIACKRPLTAPASQ